MQLVTISHRVGGNLLVITCAKALQPQADWLLRSLEEIESERGPSVLEDGAIVRIGWSIARICRQGDSLVVLEPDFLGNPFHESRRDLTCTISVQAEQNSVLAALRVEGAPVHCFEKIVLTEGCLSEPHIYLQRQRMKEGDSGWFVGAVDKQGGKLNAVYVYQLIRLRPALLKVLTLPEGYMAVFNRDSIEAILNANDELCDINNIPNK